MRQQFKVLSGKLKRPGQRLQEVALFDEAGVAINLAPETRIPGDKPDCEFVSTWVDGASENPKYSFLVTKVGDVCNACGYITGKAIAAGGTVPFLTIPPEWSGGAGVSTPACLGDNTPLGGGINLDNDGNVLNVTLAPGVSLLATDTVQINYTWVVRHV